jgi:hypothetical protein
MAKVDDRVIDEGFRECAPYGTREHSVEHSAKDLLSSRRLWLTWRDQTVTM